MLSEPGPEVIVSVEVTGQCQLRLLMVGGGADGDHGAGGGSGHVTYINRTLDQAPSQPVWATGKSLRNSSWILEI